MTGCRFVAEPETATCRKTSTVLRIFSRGARRYSISAIARNGNVSRQMVSYVLHGQKNSARVQAVIEAEWGIPLVEIRKALLSWRESMERGEKFDPRLAGQLRRNKRFDAELIS